MFSQTYGAPVSPEPAGWLQAIPMTRPGKRKDMEIRKAKKTDIPDILDLLSQILEVHAVIRPDLFVSGTRKYTETELESILEDEKKPIFVAEDGGRIIGYCFCQLKNVSGSNDLRESSSLFIDDFCVEEKSRRQHVGRMLNDYVIRYAREIGCYDITLNVWEGNDAARTFYERMGYTPRKTVMEKIL